VILGGPEVEAMVNFLPKFIADMRPPEIYAKRKYQTDFNMRKSLEMYR
jgi:hypothetical protein